MAEAKADDAKASYGDEKGTSGGEGWAGPVLAPPAEDKETDLIGGEVRASSGAKSAAAAGSDIFDKVQTFCMSSGFEKDFEAFAERHIEQFMAVLDMQAGDEHNLEYHRVYQEYLSEFEGKIADFIATTGSTVQEFHDLSERVMELDADADDFDPSRRFFIEALLATTEYDIFMGLMKEEAKKHRDSLSSQRK